MEFAAANSNPNTDAPVFDEEGNMIYVENTVKTPKISNSSVFMMIGGICVMAFIGSKIKRKVDEIN